MVDFFEGTVTSIAFGGEGIVRASDGVVVFIPYTAVGDQIRYRITERKKNFARGELTEIIHSSPDRILPHCPYFGRCGGCQLQHVNEKTQLEYKREWVKSALERQGKLEGLVVPEVISTQQTWHYRRRIVLTLRPWENRYITGYISSDSCSIVEVAECPIFSDNSAPIKVTRELAKRLQPSNQDDAKIAIVKDGDQFMLHFHFNTMPLNAKEVLEEALGEFKILSGVIAASPRDSLEYGSTRVETQVEGLKITFSAQAFMQSHPEQSASIYRSLIKHAQNLPKGKMQGEILDLYSGIGISSLMLAREGFKVTGVESNKTAIQLANMNAQQNQMPHARFIQGDVGALINKLIKTKPSLVIVNPPREGLFPHIIESLVQNPVDKLIYISCMPPTLARDLKKLCEGTYEVSSVELYDMFPQTAHVETLVTLTHVRK